MNTNIFEDNDDQFDDIFNESNLLFSAGGLEIYNSNNRNDGIVWRLVDGSIVSDYIVQKLSINTAFIDGNIPAINRGICIQHMLGSVSACFSMEDTKNYKRQIDKIFKKTEVFLKLQNKNKLSLIHSSENFEIYIDKDGTLDWNISKEKIIQKIIHSFAEFKRLHNISNSFLKFSERSVINRLLASTISNSFISEDDNYSKSVFKELEESIYARATINAKSKVIYSAILVSILVIFSSIYIYYFLSPSLNFSRLIVGLSSGTFGSLASILQRNDKIKVDFMSPLMNFVIQAFSRLILGMTFGIIVILLIQSNLITILDPKNISALCVFGIVAGFSERFVPDFLDKVSNKDNNLLTNEKSAE